MKILLFPGSCLRTGNFLKKVKNFTFLKDLRNEF
jgi:hypothetical protein